MVSVIIPYNEDRGYLIDAIKSIRSQGVGVEVIESHSPNSVAYNFNRGLERAKGEFVKFVCEDDFLPPDALKHSVEAIEDHPWVFGDAWMMRGIRKWLWTPAQAHEDFMSLDVNLQKNCINGGATLYRTELLKEIGGMNERLWTAEEYDMNLKLWTDGNKPGYVNRPIYTHRLWPGQKSIQYRHTDRETRNAEIRRIQSFYLDKVQRRDI